MYSLSAPASASYTTDVFSTGPAGGLSCPMGLAFDGKNNLFVCDGGNNQIVQIDKNGNASVVQLNVQSTNSKGVKSVVPSNPLCFPETIVFDKMGGRYSGYMYIMDGNNTIYKVKCNSGIYTSHATIVGHYLGMTIDSKDNLYYSSLDYPSDTAKYVTQRIFKITPDGASQVFIDLSGSMVYPGGLVASDEFLYVADLGGNTVAKFDLKTGAVIDPTFIRFTPPNNTTFDSSKSVSANYASPSFNPYGGNQCNITLSPTGDIIVVAGNDGSGSNTAVYRYSADGELISTMSSTEDGLNSPIGIAVDSSDKVYVGNQNGNNISVIHKTHHKH
jgi:sugar lactone lactonase YvrE